MVEIDPTNKRKRASGPRARTGCSTCRIRHVKCDESVPECLRCTSTGRKCDGYARAISAEKASLAVRKVPAKHPFLASTSYSIPFRVPGSQKDRQMLHYFCVQGAADLSGSLDPDFWNRTVLQASHDEAVVRQALIALSSIHVQYVSKGLPDNLCEWGEESAFEPLVQYNKAIRQLRKYMASRAEPSARAILTCCALLYCFESIRGDHRGALTHLENGLEILRMKREKETWLALSSASTSTSASCLSSSPKPFSTPESPRTYKSTPGGEEGPCSFKPFSASVSSEQAEDMTDLVQLFSRLDLQATFFDDGRLPKLQVGNDAWFNSVADISAPFKTLSDAQWALDTLENRIFHFLVSNNSQKFTPAEELSEDIVREKRELVVKLDAWEEMTKDIVRQQNTGSTGSGAEAERFHKPEYGEKYALTLQIHHCIGQMLLRSSFPEDPAMFGAVPNPAAEEILELTDRLQNGEGIPLATYSHSRRTFSSTTGIIAPIFLLAMRCRDMSVRQRAMSRLRASVGRIEGLFSAGVVVGICAKIAAMDEASAINWACGSETDVEMELNGTGTALEILGRDILDRPGGVLEYARTLNVNVEQ